EALAAKLRQEGDPVKARAVELFSQIRGGQMSLAQLRQAAPREALRDQAQEDRQDRDAYTQTMLGEGRFELLLTTDRETFGGNRIYQSRKALHILFGDHNIELTTDATNRRLQDLLKTYPQGLPQYAKDRIIDSLRATNTEAKLDEYRQSIELLDRIIAANNAIKAQQASERAMETAQTVADKYASRSLPDPQEAAVAQEAKVCSDCITTEQQIKERIKGQLRAKGFTPDQITDERVQRIYEALHMKRIAQYLAPPNINDPINAGKDLVGVAESLLPSLEILDDIDRATEKLFEAQIAQYRATTPEGIEQAAALLDEAIKLTQGDYRQALVNLRDALRQQAQDLRNIPPAEPESFGTPNAEAVAVARAESQLIDDLRTRLGAPIKEGVSREAQADRVSKLTRRVFAGEVTVSDEELIELGHQASDLSSQSKEAALASVVTSALIAQRLGSMAEARHTFRAAATEAEQTGDEEYAQILKQQAQRLAEEHATKLEAHSNLLHTAIKPVAMDQALPIIQRLIRRAPDRGGTEEFLKSFSYEEQAALITMGQAYSVPELGAAIEQAYQQMSWFRRKKIEWLDGEDAKAKIGAVALYIGILRSMGPRIALPTEGLPARDQGPRLSLQDRSAAEKLFALGIPDAHGSKDPRGFLGIMIEGRLRGQRWAGIVPPTASLIDQPIQAGRYGPYYITLNEDYQRFVVRSPDGYGDTLHEAIASFIVPNQEVKQRIIANLDSAIAQGLIVDTPRMSAQDYVASIKARLMTYQERVDLDRQIKAELGIDESASPQDQARVNEVISRRLIRTTQEQAPSFRTSPVSEPSVNPVLEQAAREANVKALRTVTEDEVEVSVQEDVITASMSPEAIPEVVEDKLLNEDGLDITDESSGCRRGSTICNVKIKPDQAQSAIKQIKEAMIEGARDSADHIAVLAGLPPVPVMIEIEPSKVGEVARSHGLTGLAAVTRLETIARDLIPTLTDQQRTDLRQGKISLNSLLEQKVGKAYADHLAREASEGRALIEKFNRMV
ncbi:MAG TPA: hypothetical protein VJH22_04750, partial [Candidatus Nanoarchaeia archaeon]|nr:hypothetical protein [Candidatus Nanoarchaeia archaeon]